MKLRAAALWDRPPIDGSGKGQRSQERAFVAVGEAGAVCPCILSSDFPLKGGGEGVRQRAQCEASGYSSTMLACPHPATLAAFYADITEARAVRSAARRFDHQPNAAHCLVFADPAGHPFCLSLIDEVR